MDVKNIKANPRLIALALAGTISITFLTGCSLSRNIDKTSAFDGEKVKVVQFNDEKFNLVICEVSSSDNSRANIFLAKEEIQKYNSENHYYYYELFTGDLLYCDDPNYNYPNNNLVSSTSLSLYLGVDELKSELSVEEAKAIYNQIREEYQVEQENQLTLVP